MSDEIDGEVNAESSAPAALAEPAVETPSAPVPEVTAALTPEPIPEIEIESAPATDTPPVTDKSSERFSATPPHSPALDPALRQGPNPVSPAPTPEPVPPPPPPLDTSIKSRLGQAFEALRFRKRAKLDKVLTLAAKKKSIKNDDVEKLLRVSDSTAQRYLKQLVQEGRLIASKRGNDAWYEPR
ncbi:hypothetical protein A2765_03335 [Candidatus Kaiserbacteria bacterium RIFCSPHIGHO2_01_FULL_56_24]|uniref:HTH arsR-type domain-containing protein n=1 Tax=Candidatus Kaiserbacteria bacterium RIFCSPHIGHO2_01_FULL_56_24 TaxID=1798487 RepID=A0A1F6DBF2_9BACT|nr:MAG: hypothetical protein A2765_03335 [Candidatus Kaiserbacteria bacterium RIFCSPHIGHO2_01_FULL_56_24]